MASKPEMFVIVVLGSVSAGIQPGRSVQMTNSPTEKRALEWNNRGRRLMQQGHFEKAIPYFKKAWQQAGLLAALNNWATALYSRPSPSSGGCACWASCTWAGCRSTGGTTRWPWCRWSCGRC